MNKIGFWSTSDKYGAFSNWHKCNFIFNEITFISSEQALMYYKAVIFNDNEIAEKILNSTSQRSIKAFGRKVKNFDNTIWAKKRYGLMVDILTNKFSQNEYLRDLLLSTGDAEIYEASPKDNIWGIGSKDVNEIKGMNLLGKALMEVRESLK